MRRFDIAGMNRLAAESLQDIAPMRTLKQMVVRAPRAPARRAVMASERAEKLQPQLDDELLKHIAGVAESVRSQRAERGPNQPSTVVKPAKKPAARRPPQTFDVKDPAPLLEESAKDYLPRAAKPLIKKPELTKVEWVGEPLKKKSTPLDVMKGKGPRQKIATGGGGNTLIVSGDVGAKQGDATIDEIPDEELVRNAEAVVEDLPEDVRQELDEKDAQKILRAYVSGNVDRIAKIREEYAAYEVQLKSFEARAKELLEQRRIAKNERDRARRREKKEAAARAKAEEEEKKKAEAARAKAEQEEKKATRKKFELAEAERLESLQRASSKKGLSIDTGDKSGDPRGAQGASESKDDAPRTPAHRLANLETQQDVENYILKSGKYQPDPDQNLTLEQELAGNFVYISSSNVVYGFNKDKDFVKYLTNDLVTTGMSDDELLRKVRGMAKKNGSGLIDVSSLEKINGVTIDDESLKTPMARFIFVKMQKK